MMNEKRILLSEKPGNHGGRYPVDKTVRQLFEAQVDRTPTEPAVVGPSVGIGAGTVLTYRELNRRANQLARVLTDKGAGSGSITGIMVERSIEMVVGILAILKAGGAYLPISPKYPGVRKRYMLKDSGSGLLLTHRHFKESPEMADGIHGVHVIDLEDEGFYKGESGNPAHDGGGSENLAYVTYTSGSTGNPKGVPITHANLSPLLHWGYEHMGLRPGDRTLQNLAYYFDWSAWEMLITLTSGAALYIAPEDTLLSPEACAAFIAGNEITVLHATPTQYRYLVNVSGKLETLKYLCIGAEKLTFGLLQHSFESVDEGCRVFNMYGPTEATIMAAVLEITRSLSKDSEGLSSVPIGGSLANAGLLVLDGHLNPCPVDKAGELYISGDGLAAGYLNDPEKTAGSFVKNMYEPEGITGDRLYKTGDLVRRLQDGNLEFLDRIDHQVKVRGHRIELGEIENELLKHPDVKEAVVVAGDDDAGEKHLCAYIIAHPGRKPDKDPSKVAELRKYLSGTLPAYMVPAYFMAIGCLPLTPNGKIDLKALPAPEIAPAGMGYDAPADKVEMVLTEIWARVLGIEPTVIGVDDDFFALGGHSLNAAVVLTEIHKRFDVRLPISRLFEFPVIKELAQSIGAAAEDKFIPIEKAEEKAHYPLSSAQKRLYILNRMAPDSTAYNITTVYRLAGEPDRDRLEKAFQRFIQRHESFRTSFKLVDDEPVQVIHDSAVFELEYYEGGDLLSRILPFDLSKAPLVRACVMKTGVGEHLLMVDAHHIISDGTSMEIFREELSTLYQGEELPPLPIRYKDYAEWRNRETRKEKTKKQAAYWLDIFSRDIPLLDLPLDYAAVPQLMSEGDTVAFDMGKEESGALKESANRNNLTLYMVLFAAYTILLAKLSSQEDIVVGTPAAGRPHPDLVPLVGMFDNTLVLRTYPAGEKGIGDYLDEIRQDTLQAFENQDYQFEELVNRVIVDRDPNRNPLFDVMFVLQNVEKKEEGPGRDLRLNPVTFHA
ncbi:MAG: amino acid adenylation domain-containing protein, partial [bacterium]|nr:amino acid adenylation domain-containing protein [bacterium]